MRRAAALILACLAATAAFAENSSEVERGRAIYNYRCYFCHGYSGDARTLAATYLVPRPRDFQSTDARALPLPRMARSIREGVPGTSMRGFKGILTDAQIAQVAAFVSSEFLERRAPNTRYHTVENGWPNHERYAPAFAFARGEIALDRDERLLSASERNGKALFLSTCITCHDRAKVTRPGPIWQSR
jgi:cytochrome c oxidase cbb3-type subunit III